MSLSVNESTIISIPSDNSEHHVRRGEVFLRDSPVAHALLPSKRQSYCDGCLIPSATLEPCEICAQMLYCSKSCKDSMKLPHELECKQYLAVGRFPVAEIRLLLRVCCIQDTAIRQAINKLMSHEEHFKKDQKFISDFAGLIQTIASFTGGTLPLPECELFSLLCRIRINSFVITDQWGADLGAGLFLQAARLDHSCKPNIEYIFRGKEIICFALEDIKDRSEARINYGDPLSDTRHRLEVLNQRYFFTCTCAVCLDADRDRKISSLLCCDSDGLSEPFPLVQASSSSNTKFLMRSQNPTSDLVLCCPSCKTLYSDNLVHQLSTFLTSFTDEVPTVERASDAIRLYCLLRGLKYPMKSNTKLVNEPKISGNCDLLLPTYYRLFGRCAHHILLARVCRMACFALRVENTEAVVHSLIAGSGVANFSRARFNRLLIAMGVDYFEWQMCWRAGPQFVIGLHALDLAGFLLRWITDQQFTCNDYMQSVCRLTASRPSVSNLAQLLCRLALTADQLLEKFAPFDACVAESLKQLHALL